MGLAISVIVRDNLRCVGKRHTDSWTQARREQYLICPAVRMPLSVDARVTPFSCEEDKPEETVRIVAAAEFVPVESRDSSTSVHLAAWHDFANAHGTPTPTSNQWLPLGYDICDGTFLSGLMNCAFDRAHFRESIGVFVLSLNRYHLFDRISDAERFRILICSAVPEHAPFFLVHLYAASGH